MIDLKMVLVVAAAALLVLWPQVVALLKKVKLPKSSGEKSYSEAMMALAVVRERLIDTDCFADDANNAIEVITHALVEGSDQ